MENNEIKNPHLAGYWVGRLVVITGQIDDWDFGESDEGLSKQFKTRIEFSNWKQGVKHNPILITSVNDPDDTDVTEAHFYWTFSDGTTMEAPCCIDIGDGELPDLMQMEIDTYDAWQLTQPKPTTQILLTFKDEAAVNNWVNKYKLINPNSGTWLRIEDLIEYKIIDPNKK